MVKVGVITGGYSSEHVISAKSAQTVLDHIDREKFEPHLLEIRKDSWALIEKEQKWPINRSDFTVTVNGKKLEFDIVLIMIHGTPGEDGQLQAYLDMVGMPYAGSKQLTSSITFNKWTCNTILHDLGYRCAKNFLIRSNDIISVSKIINHLGLPCFVKPNDGGSSFGVSKVKSKEELLPAIEQAFEEGTEVLIESCMIGMEVTCGVFRRGNEIVPLPITEIISQNEFFDYNAKYLGESEEITPARIPEELTREIQKNTANIYRSLGFKGIARMDYIIQDDKPYLIEINTIPGMSPQSLVPQQAAAAGISLQELFTAVIEEGLKG